MAEKELTEEQKTANEKKAKASKQRKVEEFREQCYLISKMEQLAIDNYKSGIEYKNFTTVVGNDANPAININQLFYFKNQRALLNLTPAQLALLIPKVRVFEVLYEGSPTKQANKKEREFRLQGNSYDLEKLLADPASRGQNLGLKSFTWQFTGTDPWTAANLLQANMTLWGDSLKVFESDSEYDSLLLLPQPDKLIEIKVVVGWSVPKKAALGATGNLAKSDLDDLVAALEQQSMTLLLTLTEHNFDFAQDGSFKLDLKYKGRIDIVLDQIDLLGPLNEGERKTDLALAGTRSKIKSSKEAAKDRSHDTMAGTGKELLDEQAETAGTRGLEDPAAFLAEQDSERAEIAANLAPGDAAAQKKIVKAMQREDVTAEEITYDFINNSILKSRGADRMNRIVHAIENIGPAKGKSKSRIYNVRVSAEQLDAYFDKYGGGATIDEEQRTKSKKNREARKAENEKIAEQRKNAMTEDGMSKEEADKKYPSKKAPPPPKKPTTTPPKKSSGKYNRAISLATVVDRVHPGDGAIVIPFIFLGDLMEALLGLCEFQLARSRVSFILGGMIFNDPFTGKKGRIINLADIPISMRRFSAWFHDKYNMKRPATRIPLKNFIQGILVDLIRPGLTLECFRGATTIGGNINRAGGILATTANEIPKGSQTIETLKGKLHSATENKKGAPLNNVFLITSMMDPNPPVTGDPEEDAKKGIMHYHLGRDKGILKRANFSRNNIPGLTEHRITRETGSPIDRMKQPYNVDLELVGNTLFRPGTMFYITPTIPGRNAIEIAQRLGLGGYYMTQGVDCTISPGQFAMSVKGIWNNEATSTWEKASQVAARQADEKDSTESLSSE